MTLKILLQKQLKNLYFAEKLQLKALKQMAFAAGNGHLGTVFLAHHAQTKRHMEILEDLWRREDWEGRADRCKTMQILVSEGDQDVGCDAPSQLREIGLIADARRIEHYEIASYRTATLLARMLGNASLANVLKCIQLEEEDAARKLDDAAAAIAKEEAEESPLLPDGAHATV